MENRCRVRGSVSRFGSPSLRRVRFLSVCLHVWASDGMWCARQLCSHWLCYSASGHHAMETGVCHLPGHFCQKYSQKGERPSPSWPWPVWPLVSGGTWRHRAAACKNTPAFFLICAFSLESKSMPNEKKEEESSVVVVEPKRRGPLEALVCQRTPPTGPGGGHHWLRVATGHSVVCARAEVFFLPPGSLSLRSRSGSGSSEQRCWSFMSQASVRGLSQPVLASKCHSHKQPVPGNRKPKCIFRLFNSFLFNKRVLI